MAPCCGEFKNVKPVPWKKNWKWWPASHTLLLASEIWPVWQARCSHTAITKGRFESLNSLGTFRGIEGTRVSDLSFFFYKLFYVVVLRFCSDRNKTWSVQVLTKSPQHAGWWILIIPGDKAREMGVFSNIVGILTSERFCCISGMKPLNAQL